MSIPRLHHYIPQFYLARWADSEGQVVAYRLQSEYRPPFRCIPRNICAERDLYANQALDGNTQRAQSTERKFFSRIDARASIALDALISRFPLEPSVRDDWARFLMSLFYRQPNEVRRLRARAHDEWQTILVGQHPHLSDDLVKGLGKYKTKFADVAAQDAEDLALKTLENVIDSRRIGNILVDMHWSLYVLPVGGPTFLTADLPTIKTEKLGHEQASILLPISPNHLFIAAGSERAIVGLERLAPRVVCGMVNTDVIAHARQYLIAKDESQTRFIQNRWSMRSR